MLKYKLVAAIFLIFPGFILSAQAQTKALAMDEAIAQAEEKQKDITSTQGIEYRQELEQRVVVEKPQEQEPIEAETFVRYMPKSGVHAMSGGVSLTEADSQFSYEYKLGGKLPIEFSLGSQYIGINNSTPVHLPAHLTGLVSGVSVTLPFFNIEKTYLNFEIDPAFYSDDWDFGGSNFRIPSRAIFIYRYSDKLILLAGVRVNPHYRFINVVSPTGGLIYKPNDKLSFNIIPPTPNITYCLNKSWSLFGEAGLSNDEFRINSNNGFKGAIIRYYGNRMGAGIKYAVNKYLKSSFSIGETWGRTLKYRDDLGKTALKNGLYAEFKIEAKI